MKEIAGLHKADRKKYMKNAKDVSDIALWENNIQYYKEAYSKSLEKIMSNGAQYQATRNNKAMEYRKFEVNQPSWNTVFVSRHLPEKLKDLEILSKNLGGAGTNQQRTSLHQ